MVACSGGADSLALLSATIFESRREPWRVVGVPVDHGPQEGSAERADAVVKQMAELGADETATIRVTVDAPAMGVEAAARDARYAALTELAERRGCFLVLLGHTSDDQAETVLLGLARGSGGRAIAGMRRAFDHYRRPLLDVSHVDTVTACQVAGLEPWDDPHNADDSYPRVRVRLRVLPVLEDELGPGVTESLARTADLLRADMELLDGYAEGALADAAVEGGLSVDAVAGLEAPIRTRVLRAAALAAGAAPGETFHQHVVAVDALVTDWHGQKWVDLPGRLRAVRRGGLLAFERAGSNP